MVDRFRTKPLELPGSEEAFYRADLIFYGIDHSADSLEARVFLNAPARMDHAAGPDHPAYVGSFFVFGHGGCFGDIGHCDIPEERDSFDMRLPHQLLPATRIITVTEAVQDLVEAGAETARVTVTAHTPSQRPNAALTFETVRLATYE